MDDEYLLLDHARKVYASDSFSLFRHEFEKSGALSLDVTRESGCEIKYEVKRGTNQSHSYKVTADYFGNEVECCCNRFAVTGILCSHALAVLRCLRVEQVPNQYLLKWRMKSVKKRSMRKTPSQKGRHLKGETSQKSRPIHPSSDDCLRGDLSKVRIKADGKKQSDKAFSPFCDLIQPDDDDDCGGFHHLGSPLLRHAKEIYTPKVYNLFKEEYSKSECLLYVPLRKAAYQRGLVYDFKVLRYGGVDEKMVHAEARNGMIKCSCRMFEKSGILCSHALAVYDIINIVKIPHLYIVPEFLKNRSMCFWQKIHGADYPRMLRFALHIINQYGRTSMVSCRIFEEGEESADALEEELRELSLQEEMRASNGREDSEEMVGKAKFYDDHLIKDFTFKKAETRKRELFDYASYPLSKALYRTLLSADHRVCFDNDMDDEDLLLDHAREVYASDSFCLFQHEYEKSWALFIDKSGSETKYGVKRGMEQVHSHKVSADYLGQKVECCCNRISICSYWELSGACTSRRFLIGTC